MKLYNYAPPEKKEKLLPLKLIPSSEELHLSIEKDVLELDRTLDGITIDNISRESIAYTLGKLGVSLEEYNTISTEGIKDFLQKAKQKVQALWAKIIGYYRKNYAKISMYFMSLFKSYGKLAEQFRCIRNKHKIGVSPSTQELLAKHFGYLGNDFIIHMGDIAEHLTTIINDLGSGMFSKFTALEETVSINTKFGKYLKELITKQDNPDGEILGITYSCNNKIRYIHKGRKEDDSETQQQDTASTEDSSDDNNDKKDNKKKEAKKVDMSLRLFYKECNVNSEIQTKEEFIDINFDPCLKLAKDNDALRDKVKDFSKKIEDLEKTANSSTSNASDNVSGDHFRNVLMVSSKLTMDTTYNILDNLKAITACLKAILEDAQNTSFYAYYRFMEIVEEHKVIPLPGKNVSVTGTVEVVEDGDKVFIDLNNDWPAVIQQTGLFGGFVILDYTFEGETKQQEDDDESAEAYISKGNVMLLDRKMNGPADKPTLLKDSGMTFDFLYYHEEGHIVTGQTETPFANNAEYQDSEQKYFSHMTENSADAYACKKTGTSYSTLADWRAKLGNTLIANNKEKFIENVKRYEGDIKTWDAKKKEKEQA